MAKGGQIVTNLSGLCEATQRIYAIDATSKQDRWINPPTHSFCWKGKELGSRIRRANCFTP